MARKGDPIDLAFAIKSVDVKQRIIEGYASTPDLDDGDDIVESGACKFASPGDVQVFVGHQWRLGALPVGVPVEIKQDAKGLYTKTKIHETTSGDDLLAVAAAQQELGKPLGISIGYSPSSVKAKYEHKDGRMIRRISSLDLKEYSFTPIPMNENARVTAVKAADMSDEDKRREIQEALNARSLGPLVPSTYSYVVATYGDYVIVCDGDDYWQIPYVINGEGEADLGDAIEVEQVWQPKTGGDAEVASKAADQSWAAVDKSALPKSAFAYAPGKKRSDWKLPHHNADGSVNAQGVKSALAAIGGARTGKPMSIPATARAHLEAHAQALGIGDDAKARVDLGLKAGKVLSAGNIARIQTIHDTAHDIAESAGHVLHDTTANDEDSVQEPNDNVTKDFAIFGGLLELEHAVATSNLSGGN